MNWSGVLGSVRHRLDTETNHYLFYILYLDGSVEYRFMNMCVCLINVIFMS